MCIKILLNEVRTKHDMSINQLAKLSGVSKSFIYYIEEDGRIPTIKILCKLAKALNVKVTDLFECQEDFRSDIDK